MIQYIKCSKCKQWKSLDKFSIKRSKKNGLDSQCKQCKHNYYLQYYNKVRQNKDKYYLIYKQKLNTFMKQLKTNGCAICGYDRCSKALDFHHVNPVDKIFLINTKTITTHTNKELKDELNKCILLCCICHKEVEGMEA